MFKRHLSDVQKLNDEEFNELFEGNTDYKTFSVPNIKDFYQLVSKFDDNKDLIIQWYKEEKYYEFILQIWKPNILQKLKDKNTQNEKNEILKQYKIDTSKWDKDFQEHFNIIINHAPIKIYAERMKYYIKEDYGNFDELIKSVDKCKSNIEKSEETTCKNTLKANMDSTIDKMINQFIPNFMSNLQDGYNKFKEEKQKKQEDIAIEKIQLYKENEYKKYNKDSEDFDIFGCEESNEESTDEIPKDYLDGLSEKNKTLLISEVKKMYENENKNSETNGGEEMEKLKELAKKFNEEGENFCGIGIKDQAAMAFENDMIKNSILGLSISNCCYSYLHLGETLINCNKNLKEFNSKYDEIKKNFEKHKNEITLISEDIDKAIEQIINTGKNFQKDLEDVENLIKDIEKVIQDQNNELNKTYLNLGASIAGTAISFFASSSVKNNKEYNYSAGANVTAIIGNIIDIKVQKDMIKQSNEILQKANELRKDIIEEIDKLRNKFNQLSVKHFS